MLVNWASFEYLMDGCRLAVLRNYVWQKETVMFRDVDGDIIVWNCVTVLGFWME
jgi:hypothetical protein